ncbi:MAG: flagellar basal body P-ring formation chaperone FlgA [Pseudomonadaceae bacterium]|jgi:flagella basal body P-ring formation protein FlgA|uniref:Flagella basal body P-ring formation protein FlgA n=1 Tax=Halopseudomonas formosensis TaxID=1002526 RepID=A0A1I6B3I5_9GAMM|nr:flagellar basal body P-ring formation chaperone FlgA [Halopseudomonas formosensis]MDY3198835.1 flagellar basal body P-ring formation chaperone FlgA [Pseudomonadaceae bacterium]SFQ75473.1 flagella basal body P-ring formation protein FlgA [Halopseudomonas formosensis]
MQFRAPFIRLIIAITLTGCGSLHANPLIDQLIGTTTAYLEDQVALHLAASSQPARHEISVNRLDPRLRLPLCPADAISAQLESPEIPVGRVTVRVSCDSSQVQWRLFVPAQVDLFQSVVVLTRPLARHAILGPEDITLRERNIGQISGGYLLQPEQAIGMRLRRPVQADSVLSPQQLEQDETVKRGDRVVITAANSRVAVRMPGEALESGGTGAQIRVRNTRSDRVVRARIVGPGQVEVHM